MCVVTTASLPWQTGTAINPLLRAAYLAHKTKCQVSFVRLRLRKTGDTLYIEIREPRLSVRGTLTVHCGRCEQVTLVIPWLSVDEQKKIFPKNLSFETPGEQAKWVKDWVLQRCGFEASFDILFYPGEHCLQQT